MRPQGPIYFNMGGPPAHKLDTLLRAVDCQNIDNYHGIGLRIIYRGSDWLGFHYYILEEGDYPHPDWTKLTDEVYCDFVQDGLICTRGDWRWE